MNTPIALRVAGLARCHGAEEDVKLFLWMLRWCVSKQRAFKPSMPTASEELELTVGEMAADLAAEGYSLSELDAKKAHALLQTEGLYAGLGGERTAWTLTLSRKVLRPYFEVETLEDFLGIAEERHVPQAAPANPLVEPTVATPVILAMQRASAGGLDPEGEGALRVSDLHPLVQGACDRLLRNGHYSEGVFAASKALTGFVRERSGLSDLDESTLMGKAFSSRDPRILVGSSSTTTGRSIQRGTMLLAQGIVARLRNPLTHEDIEPTRGEAMEMLAVISRVARDSNSASDFEE